MSNKGCTLPSLSCAPIATADAGNADPLSLKLALLRVDGGLIRRLRTCWYCAGSSRARAGLLRAGSCDDCRLERSAELDCGVTDGLVVFVSEATRFSASMWRRIRFLHSQDSSVAKIDRLVQEYLTP